MTGTNHAPDSGTNSGLRLVVGNVHANGPRALAASLEEGLRAAIRDGRLPAGTRLPSTRGLAADLDVSRGVVVRAYEQLVAESYLTAHTGRGTSVGRVRAAVTDEVGTNTHFEPANIGTPELGWFPRRDWLHATEAALQQLAKGDLGYGDPRGHPRLRRALSAYLGRTRAVVAPPDQIVVTTGYAQAIRLVAELLAAQGGTRVGVEDPGSVGVRHSLTVGGVEPVAVTVDESGLVVQECAARSVAAVAVTPAHQFPTGVVLAPGRRTALLDWSASTGGLVVEDDYDAEYRYDHSPVGAVQGLAPDRVIYGGSVSKTLAPGLRIGWLVLPARFVEEMAQRKFWADIGTPVVGQVALAEFLDGGSMDRHVRWTAARYGERRQVLLDAVAEHLRGWRVTGIAAGLHAVLVPPDGQPVPGPDRTLDTGMRVLPLEAYRQRPGPPALVVGYGAATPDQIRRTIAGIADSDRTRSTPPRPPRREVRAQTSVAPWRTSSESCGAKSSAAELRQ